MAKLKISTIPAGDFKAKCLSLMEEVREHHVSYVITKRGVPVARLVPIHEEPIELFGCLKGTAQILGDLVEPLEMKWEADQ